MKAVVIFESMYGNTRAIAEAVAEGIGAGRDVQVTVLPVSAADRELIRDADLLVVGGPTHAHGMSGHRPGAPRTMPLASKTAVSWSIPALADLEYGTG